MPARGTACRGMWAWAWVWARGGQSWGCEGRWGAGGGMGYVARHGMDIEVVQIAIRQSIARGVPYRVLQRFYC